MDKSLIAMILIIAAFIGSLGWIVQLSNQDKARWYEFAALHNCVVIGESEFMPGKLGYKCDDGITYWK